MRVREKKEGKGVGNRKAAEPWRRQSAEERERERRGKSERSQDARKKEFIICLRKKATEQKRESWRRI